MLGSIQLLPYPIDIWRRTENSALGKNRNNREKQESGKTEPKGNRDNKIVCHVSA
jgi:hypothetical protein